MAISRESKNTLSPRFSIFQRFKKYHRSKARENGVETENNTTTANRTISLVPTSTKEAISSPVLLNSRAPSPQTSLAVELNSHAELNTKPQTKDDMISGQTCTTSIPPANQKGFFSLPKEIRQQILGYLINTDRSEPSEAVLTLKNRHAIPLSQVCRQMREDLDYLQDAWHSKNSIRNVLCRMWTDEENAAYRELEREWEQSPSQSPQRENKRRILQALDYFRAQRHEMQASMNMLKQTVEMQRELVKELREENQRLTLLAELRHAQPDM